MKKSVGIVLFSILLSGIIQSSVKAFEGTRQTQDYHITEIDKKIQSVNSKKLSVKNKLLLAELYKKTGRDDDAIKLLTEVLKTDSKNSKALFLSGEINKRNYNFAESEKYFSSIKPGSPEYNESLIRLFEIFISRKDEIRAKQLLNAIDKQKQSELFYTVNGIYQYSSLKLKIDHAQKSFENSLSINPENIISTYYLANIKLDQGNRSDAKKLFKKIIQRDFYYSPAHALLGFIEFLDGNTKKGVEEFKTALAVNPLDIRALTSYGNGMTDKTYDDIEKNNKNLVQPEEFNSLSKKMILLINEHKVNNVNALVNDVLKKYPNNIHSYILAGCMSLNLRNHAQAIKMFKKATGISHEYGVANNCLAVATSLYLKSQEISSRTLNLDKINFSGLDINSLKKIFINYEQLTEKDKKIVAYSVLPFKNYIPVLSMTGSTHYIIPLYEKSTDYEFGKEFKNQRSFDLRLWDDIRGRGGFNSATGAEDIQSAYNLGFNTLTHEFSHQVHGYAFTTDQKLKIQELFNNAKKNNRFLDYYAGSNEYEYFAQGVEAYNSTQGKNTLKATAKNTRELLIKTDKPLYEFIQEMEMKADVKENYASGYTQKADTLFAKGEFDSAEKEYLNALDILPDYQNALNNLGNLYRYSVSAVKAREIHLRAVEKYPSKAESYINLGDDDFYITGDYSSSIQSYLTAIKVEPEYTNSYYQLANAYYQTGNLKESINYYDDILKKDTNSSSAFIGLAYNYQVIGNFQKAKENFTKAFSINKNIADAQAEFGRLYLDNNDLKNAENQIGIALFIDKENPAAVSNKGLLEIKQFSDQRGINYLQRAVELDPGNLLLKIRLAYGYLQKGDFINTGETLNNVQNILNSSELPKTVYDKVKIKYLSYNIKDNYTKAEYYYTSALMKEKQGLIADAIIDYKKSLEILPLFNKPYFKLKNLQNSEKDREFIENIEKQRVDL